MTILNVTEFGGAGGAVSKETPVGKTVMAVQDVAFSSSATLGQGTTLVRVIADANCRVIWGASPSLNATGKVRVVADTPEYFGVNPGDTIAVIAGS